MPGLRTSSSELSPGPHPGIIHVSRLTWSREQPPSSCTVYECAATRLTREGVRFCEGRVGPTDPSPRGQRQMSISIAGHEDRA